MRKMNYFPRDVCIGCLMHFDNCMCDEAEDDGDLGEDATHDGSA